MVVGKMLPSSVRRVVVSTTPQSPVLASFLSSGPRAAAAALPGRQSGHQRRCSSSKPSSSDKGAKDISAGQQQSAVPASSAETTTAEAAPAEPKPAKAKATGERRKRKAKESLPTRQLPVVPSTQHLSKEALGLSTFFSLHRPISVTQNLPKTVTEDAFAAIFASGARPAKVSDVISTLSHTVDQLEQPMSNMSIGGSQRQDLDAGSTRIDLKHPDGTESAIYVQLNAMSGQFLPFQPPPAPRAGASSSGATTSVDLASESAIDDIDAEFDAETAPSHRVYKAILTIEETTDADGQVKVVAHSPELIEEGSGPAGNAAPRSFLERMAQRQLRQEHANRVRRLENGMLAISVRRQKKLKMKKKKYKKLMRRTRNLRRKLDRT